MAVVAAVELTALSVVGGTHLGVFDAEFRGCQGAVAWCPAPADEDPADGAAVVPIPPPARGDVQGPPAPSPTSAGEDAALAAASEASSGDDDATPPLVEAAAGAPGGELPMGPPPLDAATPAPRSAATSTATPTPRSRFTPVPTLPPLPGVIPTVASATPVCRKTVTASDASPAGDDGDGARNGDGPPPCRPPGNPH